MDYAVVDKVLKEEPEIPIFFILPYNTIFPQTKAWGYTMEYLSLDENFMFKALLGEKLVYDWTVNDEEAIPKSLNLGVDGVITDQLTLVQEQVETMLSDRNYYHILQERMISLFDFDF